MSLQLLRLPRRRPPRVTMVTLTPDEEAFIRAYRTLPAEARKCMLAAMTAAADAAVAAQQKRNNVGKVVIDISGGPDRPGA